MDGMHCRYLKSHGIKALEDKLKESLEILRTGSSDEDVGVTDCGMKGQRTEKTEV